MPEDDYMRRAL